MFRNRSFTLVAALAFMGIVAVICGTVVTQTKAAPGGNDVSAIGNMQPNGVAESRVADAKIMTADEADALRAMQPYASGWWEYRDDPLTNKSYAFHYSTTPTGPIIDASFEVVSNAPLSAGAKIMTADEEDALRTMQPSVSGWWEYRDDPLTNTSYASHYSTTPNGPIVDATFQVAGNAPPSAGAKIMTADEADALRTMQPFASGWWEYRDDSLTNTSYASHYSITPNGPIIDATFQVPGKTK